jgi:hypothetical protein
MKKVFLLFLILFSMGVLGKETPNEYRVKVTPNYSGAFYIVQYRKKTSVLKSIWKDLEFGNPNNTLDAAKELIFLCKYDDSVRVAQQKITYITF